MRAALSVIARVAFVILGVVALVVLWFVTYGLIHPFTANSAIALLSFIALFKAVGLTASGLRREFRERRGRTR